jgi:hypothetical protein
MVAVGASAVPSVGGISLMMVLDVIGVDSRMVAIVVPFQFIVFVDQRLF